MLIEFHFQRGFVDNFVLLIVDGHLSIFTSYACSTRTAQAATVWKKKFFVQPEVN